MQSFDAEEAVNTVFDAVGLAEVEESTTTRTKVRELKRAHGPAFLQENAAESAFVKGKRHRRWPDAECRRNRKDCHQRDGRGTQGHRDTGRRAILTGEAGRWGPGTQGERDPGRRAMGTRDARP